MDINFFVLLGCGYETALDFAKRGARVILACRNERKAIDVVRKIKEQTNNDNVVYKIMDLASFKSVRLFATNIKATEKRLDILVNNAGVGALPNELTEDGLPPAMQINYLSHFLLTILLLGKFFLFHFQWVTFIFVYLFLLRLCSGKHFKLITMNHLRRIVKL